MAHAQKPDFVFRRTGRVHLNRRGRHFSRLLAAELWASAVVMLDTPCSEVVWRVLATHSIRQFPLHFLSRASPRAITFQLKSKSSFSWSVVNLFMIVFNKWWQWDCIELHNYNIDYTGRLLSLLIFLGMDSFLPTGIRSIVTESLTAKGGRLQERPTDCWNWGVSSPWSYGFASVSFVCLF
jgi:hypothetical protein